MFTGTQHVRALLSLVNFSLFFCLVAAAAAVAHAVADDAA